jgi:hypothetical protein
MSVMSHKGVAILAAAVAAWIFGALWYGLLGKAWMRAVGFTERPKPTPAPFVISFVAELLMAAVLASVLELLPKTAAIGLSVGLVAWIGLVLPTLTVNHRYQGSPWTLTAIDGGHWLGVLLLMGLVLGLFGA